MVTKTVHKRLGHWTLVFAVFQLIAVPSCLAADQNVRSWQPVAARPDLLRGTERRLLDRAEQFLAAEQWEDAINLLIRILESDSSAVVPSGDQIYVSVQDYCHRLISQLPPKPLATYRSLVDTAAESWYREGIAEQNPSLLGRVIDRCFCSTVGDDALLAYGELALQRGQYQLARNAWEGIAKHANSADSPLIYPATDLSRAEVQARLIIASIRQGDWWNAERSLGLLNKAFPNAKGQRAGREVGLSEHLAAQLQQARRSAIPSNAKNWQTFSATSSRSDTFVGAAGPYELVWSRPIKNSKLASFPIVSKDLVLYQDAESVQALELTSGREKFQAEGSLFQSPPRSAGGFGQAYHVLFGAESQIWGVTATPLGRHRKPTRVEVRSSLWSLDLLRDGALKFSQTSEDSKVAFLGSPVVSDKQVWAPIYANDQSARAGVACYDRSTGEPSWQRWLCRSNSPATGVASELVTNLLAYNSGIIYANTNLGAIAAIRAADGKMLWLRTYQRQSSRLHDARRASFYRSPNPCFFSKGMVCVLPNDSHSLLALDAATGNLLWKYAVKNPQARLLGVTGEEIVLVNQGLQVLDRVSGKLVSNQEFSQQIGQPALLEDGAQNILYLPIAARAGTKVYSIDVKNPGSDRVVLELSEPGGANLCLHEDYLVAAGPTKISTYRRQSKAAKQTLNIQTTSSEY